MAPVRVGIIGLRPAPEGDNDLLSQPGYWAVNSHLPALRSMPEDYEIVAVCNSSVESAARAIKRYGLPASTKAYGSPVDLANDSTIDLVVVSVNVEKHLELAKPALEKKKDVFVEWPLAASLSQAEELSKLANVAGVRTLVGLQARADPLVARAKGIVDSGQIGKVVHSSAWIGTSITPVQTWLAGGEYWLNHKSGGNDFFILFGHFLDSFTHVLGDFAEVQAILRSTISTVTLFDLKGTVVNPTYPKTSPDHILVQGILENDATVSFSARKSKAEIDDVSFRWIISGTEGEIEILQYQSMWQFGAPKRTLKLRVGSGEVQNIDFLNNDTFEASLSMPATNVARQYHAFMKGNTESFATFESALKTQRLLDRIVTAAGWERV